MKSGRQGITEAGVIRSEKGTDCEAESYEFASQANRLFWPQLKKGFISVKLMTKSYQCNPSDL